MKMKKNRHVILRSLFYTVLMFLLMVCFSSCRTKFGGINGTGVELSLAYILCHSIIGGIILGFELCFLVANGEGIVCVHLPAFFVSIFLFVLPFLFCSGYYYPNLFWLKSLASSIILFSVVSCCYVLKDDYDLSFKDGLGFFLCYCTIAVIEILGLIFTGDNGYIYRPYLWSFSHLAVLYVCLCAFTMGRSNAKISHRYFNNSLGLLWIGIYAIISGGVAFIPLFFNYSKIKWLMILGVGFIVQIIIWFIYECKTSSAREEIDFFNEQLRLKKKNAIENLGYRHNSSVYNQTKDDINNAKTEEEVDRLMSEWINYENTHPICPLCKTEHSRTDKFCNYCEVSIEHPYPICPDCGNRIHYSKDIICSNCGFDWISFLERELKQKSLYKVVDIYNDVIKPKNLYIRSLYGNKINLSEGDYIYDTYKLPTFSYSNSGVNQQGIIHISKITPNNEYPFYVYSAKLFNETHRIFEEKQKREENAHLRKIKEEAEFARRQEEERIKKEQEQKESRRQYLKQISEQTGIILD